jgi:hypothetical protein
MHSCVFLSCVYSLDSSEGVGESVEIKHILDMNQARETLMVALSLPLPPRKEQSMLSFHLLAIVFISFRNTFLLFYITLYMIPDASHGSFGPE